MSFGLRGKMEFENQFANKEMNCRVFFSFQECLWCTDQNRLKHTPTGHTAHSYPHRSWWKPGDADTW